MPFPNWVSLRPGGGAHCAGHGRWQRFSAHSHHEHHARMSIRRVVTQLAYHTALPGATARLRHARVTALPAPQHDEALRTHRRITTMLHHHHNHHHHDLTGTRSPSQLCAAPSAVPRGCCSSRTRCWQSQHAPTHPTRMNHASSPVGRLPRPEARRNAAAEVSW